MTKKFVSLVLSLALVIGLIPIMSISVSAAGETSYYSDDFENYNLGDSWYDSASGSGGKSVIDKSGTTKWSSGGALKGEIVTMTGDDGNSTQAMKITLVTRDGSFGGNERFYVKGAGTANTTGIQVVEAKFYIPEENEIARFSFGQIRKYNNELDLSANDNNVSTAFKVSDEWVKVTLVVNLDTDETIVYVNDIVASYHEYSYSGDSVFPTYFQVSSASAGTYIILDDVKMYHSPSNVTVSTVCSDAANVSSKISPVVNFSESLLKTTVHSDGLISVDNIEFYKTADNSATVEINAPVISADNKSITIDPVDELEKGVGYTVTVKNLKDMYGRDIPSATFNFTTSEPSSITVSQPVFTKENLFAAGSASQNITTLENGYIKASSTVNNSANTAKEVMVLAMLKDGNDIKYFQFENITVPANGSAAFTAGFQVDNASTQKIETVVWDSIYNKTPLADKYEFSSSGYVQTALDTLLGE